MFVWLLVTQPSGPVLSACHMICIFVYLLNGGVRGANNTGNLTWLSLILNNFLPELQSLLPPAACTWSGLTEFNQSVSGGAVGN